MAKPIISKASGKHTATVIFSHGLGDSGHGWSFLADMLGPKIKHITWIFPNAPVQPVTVNMGMSMPSWYDIHELGANSSDNRYEDEKGMLESSRSINAIISEQMGAGIDSKRILVGGFSQGSVIALLTGLTSERKLAGIVVLSGYVPLRAKMTAMRTDVALDFPVFWGHGIADPVVPYAWGKESLEFLRDKLKVKSVTFKSYPGMGHSANDEELIHLAEFIKQVLPEDEATN